jgi:cytochrome c biogenesis protein CcdA
VVALILLVISVGLADAVNPSTLAPALVIVTGTGRGAARRLAGFTAGVFAVSLVGGVALVLGPGQLLLDALPHPGPHAKAVVALVGGLLLLCLAAALWLGRARLARRLAGTGGGAARANRGALALGAGIMAVEFPTALPYFAAIAAILAAHIHVGLQIALIVLYNVAFVAPLVALLVVREVAGERARTRLEAFGTWLRLRAPALLAVLLAVLGVVVGAVGVARLASAGPTPRREHRRPAAARPQPLAGEARAPLAADADVV